MRRDFQLGLIFFTLLASIWIRFIHRGQAVTFSLFPVHLIIQVYNSFCNCRGAHASHCFLEFIMLMVYSIGLVVEVYVLVSSISSIFGHQNGASSAVHEDPMAVQGLKLVFA